MKRGVTEEFGHDRADERHPYYSSRGMFAFQDPNAPGLGQLLHYGRDGGRDPDRVVVRRHHARRRLVYAPRRLVNAAFDQGCWRRRPRGSFAPRSPELHRRSEPEIPRKRNRRSAAHPARAGRAASRRPSQNAAPDSSATTRQGIKNTISPAGNVGERARRRHGNDPYRRRIVLRQPADRRYRMVETMRMEGHKALVHTAAGVEPRPDAESSICLKDGVGLVNVVRDAKQEELLARARSALRLQFRARRLSSRI